MKNVTYISAGAGSGKTFTLIEKLSDLIINHGVKPEQVILTTFTVKAANEFKEKAKAKLYSQGRYDDALRLDQALIGTVHSVCQQMIGKYWFNLGLAPGMGVMADEDTSYYISQSLADLPTESELKFLHNYCYNFDIRRSEGFKNLDYDFWKEQLKRIISLATNYELYSFQESGKRSLDFAKQFCQGKKVYVSDDELGKMYTEVTDYVNNNARIKNKTKYIEPFETALKRKGNKDIAWLKSLKAAVAPKYGPTCEDVAGRLAGLWSSTNVYDLQKRYIHLMFDLAKRWQDSFAQFKREKNLLDYNDMEKYMRQLLQDKDVVSEISRSYRYLFVDEFQDSSPMQVKIFDALSNLMEHSYWVGDSKQAIYGFRGSDIGMVNAVVENVTRAEGCDSYSLDTCWRSLPDIVELNNSVFTRTFNGMVDIDKVRLKKQRKNKNGMQSLLYIATNEDIKVADHIAKMVKDDIRPSDIALLARYNNTLDNIALDLNDKYNIPANRENIPVTETKTGVLVEALLRIVSSGKDLLAKAQVAILTEENLATRQIIEKKLLFDSEEGNSAEDFLADTALIRRLAGIKLKLKQQSVAAAIETMVIELGLFDMVKRIEDDPALGKSCLQTIISTAKAYEEHSVQMNMPATMDGFATYLETVAPACHGDTEGVQLHTYHSCKGLQWKYVILTSLDTDVTNDGKVVKNDIYGVHIAHDNKPTAANPYPAVHIRLAPWLYGKSFPDEIMAKIRQLQIFHDTINATKEEANRLLYVGMTRPCDALIIDVAKKKNIADPLKWFSCVGLCNIHADTGHNTSVQDLLGIGINFAECTLTGEEFAELADYKYDDDNETARVLRIEQPLTRSSLHLRYVSPSGISKKGTAVKVCGFDLRIDFGKQPVDMAAVGNCIHQIFACCDGTCLPPANMMKDIISNYGLFGIITQWEQISEAWDNLVDYLTKVHGRPLKIYHERPFRMGRNGQTVIGSMDLVWQTAKGDILVDFKTCPMGPKAILDDTSEHYAGLYAGQLDAYSAALTAAGEEVLARYIYYPVSGLLVSIGYALSVP